jgi:hypothetical protein
VVDAVTWLVLALAIAALVVIGWLLTRGQR